MELTKLEILKILQIRLNGKCSSAGSCCPVNIDIPDVSISQKWCI